MPLLRKLIKVGNSRAVIIPPDWLRYHEDKTGQPVKIMLMEVNNIITLSPKKESKSESRESQGLEKGEQNNTPPNSPAVKTKETRSRLPKKTTEITRPLYPERA